MKCMCVLQNTCIGERTVFRSPCLPPSWDKAPPTFFFCHAAYSRDSLAFRLPNDSHLYWPQDCWQLPGIKLESHGWSSCWGGRHSKPWAISQVSFTFSIGYFHVKKKKQFVFFLKIPKRVFSCHIMLTVGHLKAPTEVSRFQILIITSTQTVLLYSLVLLKIRNNDCKVNSYSHVIHHAFHEFEGPGWQC